MRKILFLEYLNSEKFHQLQKIFLFFITQTSPCKNQKLNIPKEQFQTGFFFQTRQSLTAAYKAD